MSPWPGRQPLSPTHGPAAEEAAGSTPAHHLEGGQELCASAVGGGVGAEVDLATTAARAFWSVVNPADQGYLVNGSNGGVLGAVAFVAVTPAGAYAAASAVGWGPVGEGGGWVTGGRVGRNGGACWDSVEGKPPSGPPPGMCPALDATRCAHPAPALPPTALPPTAPVPPPHPPGGPSSPSAGCGSGAAPPGTGAGAAPRPPLPCRPVERPLRHPRPPPARYGPDGRLVPLVLSATAIRAAAANAPAAVAPYPRWGGRGGYVLILLHWHQQGRLGTRPLTSRGGGGGGAVAMEV